MHQVVSVFVHIQCKSTKKAEALEKMVGISGTVYSIEPLTRSKEK